MVVTLCVLIVHCFPLVCLLKTMKEYDCLNIKIELHYHRFRFLDSLRMQSVVNTTITRVCEKYYVIIGCIED